MLKAWNKYGDAFVLLLLLMVYLAFASHVNIRFSDPMAYVTRAYYNIESVKHALQMNDIFSNRFGLTGLISLGILLFGDNTFAYLFFPLLLHFIAFYLFIRLFNMDNLRRVLISVIYFSYPIVWGLLDFEVDFTVNTFFFFAVFCTQRNYTTGKAIYFHLAAICMALMFITKEVAILYLPLVPLLSLQFKDDKKYRIRGLLLMVYSAVLLALFYFIVNGNPLFRLNIIQEGHNTSVWSYHGQTLYQRTLLRWLHVANFMMSRFPAMVFAMLYMLMNVRQRKLNFVDISVLFFFAELTFMSTSPTEYNPVPVVERTWSLLLPLALLSIAKFERTKMVHIIICIVLSLVGLGSAYILKENFKVTALTIIAGMFIIFLAGNVNRLAMAGMLFFCGLFTFVQYKEWKHTVNDLDDLMAIMATMPDKSTIYTTHSRLIEDCYLLTRTLRKREIQLIYTGPKDDISGKIVIVKPELMAFECKYYSYCYDNIPYKTLPVQNKFQVYR